MFGSKHFLKSGPTLLHIKVIPRWLCSPAPDLALSRHVAIRRKKRERSETPSLFGNFLFGLQRTCPSARQLRSTKDFNHQNGGACRAPDPICSGSGKIASATAWNYGRS